MSKPIYPDYKGNYKGKLLQPILKHTKVRRPMSVYKLDPLNPLYIDRLVTDISTGLEEPLETAWVYNCSCFVSTLLPGYKWHLPSCFSHSNALPQYNNGKPTKPKVKQQKGDWNETLKDMNRVVFDEYAEVTPETQQTIKRTKLYKNNTSIWLWSASNKPKSLLERIKWWKK